MRKTLFFFGCLALLAAGCNKVQNVEEPTEEPVVEKPARHLKFDIQVNIIEAETRVVKTQWEIGDEIDLVFNCGFDAAVPLVGELRYTGSWVGPGFYDAGPGIIPEEFLLDHYDTANPDMNVLGAVYLSDEDIVPYFTLDRSDQTCPRMVFSESDFLVGFYMSDSNVPYTIVQDPDSDTDYTLHAELNLGIMERTVHFYIDGILGRQFTLRCEKIGPTRFGGFYNWYNGSGVPYGPIAFENKGNLGDPIPGERYANGDEGGGEFVGYVGSDFAGHEEEFVIYVTDNRYTDNPEDDITYRFSKKATFSQHGVKAVKLPRLDSGRWTTVKESDINPGFDAFKNENQW